MNHLYFVRHGLSEMNKRGIFSGRTNTPLAPEGIDQAHAVSRDLKSLNIDYILSSPMQRARQTAEIIADNIGYPIDKIAIMDDLMEREFGSLEGTEFNPKLKIDGNAGVETDAEILARAQRGIDYLQSLPHDNILLVSHGAVGRALRHVLHPEIAYHAANSIDNAEMVELL